LTDIEHHRQPVVTATAPTGERWTVRSYDLYGVSCELAGQVWVELGDG
jgi:hypothetical protein